MMNGEGDADIAINEGMVPAYVAQMRWRFKKDGHKIPRAQRKSDLQPRETLKVRSLLGSKLSTLDMTFTPTQLAAMTGLTKKQQTKARCGPGFEHDWTLSQIARLAACRGMTLEEMLWNCMTPPASIGSSSSATTSTDPTPPSSPSPAAT